MISRLPLLHLSVRAPGLEHAQAEEEQEDSYAIFPELSQGGGDSDSMLELLLGLAFLCFCYYNHT